MNNSHKLLIITGVLSLILVCGGFVYTAERTQQKKTLSVEKEIALESEKISDGGEIYQSAHQLFDTAKPSYLKMNLAEEDVSQVRKKMSAVQNSVEKVQKEHPSINTTKFDKASKALQEIISDAKTKIETQGIVNSLFEGKNKAINGTTVNTALPIQEKATQEQINQASTTMDPLESSDWKTSIIKILGNASAQIEWNQKASKAVAALFNGETVKEDATEKQYNAAQALVSQIKSQTIKGKLESQLAKVKAKLDEEKAEEEAVETDEDTASEDTQTDEPSGASGYQPPNSSGSSNSTGSGNSGSGDTSSGGSSGGLAPPTTPTTPGDNSTGGGNSDGGGSSGTDPDEGTDPGQGEDGDAGETPVQ